MAVTWSRRCFDRAIERNLVPANLLPDLMVKVRSRIRTNLPRLLEIEAIEDEEERKRQIAEEVDELLNLARWSIRQGGRRT